MEKRARGKAHDAAPQDEQVVAEDQVEVGAGGDLTAGVVDTAGEPRFSLTLEPR